MEKLFTLRELARELATDGKSASAWLKELREAARIGQIETIQKGGAANAPHLVTKQNLRRYIRAEYRLNEVSRAAS